MKVGMKQGGWIKLNDNVEIEVITFNRKNWRIRVKKDGEVTFAESFIKEFEIVDRVQEVVADALHEELEEMDYVVEVVEEGQLIVHTFKYDIWVAVIFYDNKIVYSLSTVKEEDKGTDEFERNMTERKTWKGLMNYIKRYDV